MSVRLAALVVALSFTAAAFADEAQVKRGIESRFPGMKVTSVAKTPYSGLYEVVVGDTIFYADEKVNFVFRGEIIDARSQKNVTEERQQKLSAIKFEDLPLEIAIKQVRGNGKRVVAIFSDPYCPYCKRLDQALMREDDITIYTFLFPIIRAESADKSRAIWCAPDRAKAYYDFMLNGRDVAVSGACSAPVDRWLAVGQKFGVRATPTSFAANGQRILGARPEELVKLIDEARK